jgi:hypothetical protein
MPRYVRKVTIVCSFEKRSPRISAFEFHEWIHRELKLDTEEVAAPEMPNDIIKEHRTKYGIVNGVTDEKWSNLYRYAVRNGIRIATIDLRMHIPSHLCIAGYRTLISYIGQPTTCYICNGTTHIANKCPSRQK